MATPVQVQGWDGAWMPKGAVLSLYYLTPDPTVCKQDDRAYNLLCAVRGVAMSNYVTNGSTAYPTGHDRISDRVWRATVVLAKEGVIGSIVPKVLQPCPGTGTRGQYTLTEVQQWAGEAGVLRSLEIDAKDALEAVVLDKQTGGVNSVGNAASQAVTGQDVGENANDAKDFLRGLAGSLLPVVLVLGVAWFLVHKAT